MNMLKFINDYPKLFRAIGTVVILIIVALGFAVDAYFFNNKNTKIKDRFQRDDVNNVIIDKKSAANGYYLKWEDTIHAESAMLTWSAAKAYCESLNLDGETGWRLPEKSELESIHDTDFNTQDHHFSLDTVFKHVSNQAYWSTQKGIAVNTSYAVFYDGFKSFAITPTNSSTINVRCVHNLTGYKVNP